ncbi:MAG: MBL fold metallo-hydrolase [Actinomycetota bacterium]|nr:MBL fold metallo-hydrolase [Actinomycetota bacterium]
MPLDDFFFYVNVCTEIYTGHVVPGGPAQVRPLPGLRITKVSVGPMDNNAYLLEDAAGGRCLIDAAAEPERLVAVVGKGRLDLVVTTHRHADHWGALAEVVNVTGARTAAGRTDAHAIPVPTSDPLDDGETLPVAGLRVIALQGHTPGSIALLYDDPYGTPHLFTGDSLFPGGPGKTTSPEDFASLMDDLEDKVFGQLPDSTWIYPGHGRDTTLRAERPHLAEWRARGW